MTNRLGVAVVGAGYWGPNLVRNFRNAADWDLASSATSTWHGPSHRR